MTGFDDRARVMVATFAAVRMVARIAHTNRRVDMVRMREGKADQGDVSCCGRAQHAHTAATHTQEFVETLEVHCSLPARDREQGEL